LVDFVDLHAVGLGQVEIVVIRVQGCGDDRIGGCVGLEHLAVYKTVGLRVEPLQRDRPLGVVADNHLHVVLVESVDVVAGKDP